MKLSFTKNAESEFSDKESKSSKNKENNSDGWEGKGWGCGKGK